MKRVFSILSATIVALLLFSCGSKVEETADALLASARVEFENGKYNSARMLLDSIKITAPKAYKTLREAEILRREVMIKEKERDVAYFEEELQALVAVRDSLASNMVLNKDKRYQDKGYYSTKSQAISLNTQNNFLRASVHEDGSMYLTSLYRGKSIKHKTVKLSSGGTFVSCSKPFLERNYKEYGVNNERRDYKYGQDNGLIDFILVTEGKIEVEISGEKNKVKYTLRDADAEAVRKVLELSQAITAVKKAEVLLDEANFSLEFLRRSEARSAANTSSQEEQ